MQTEDPSQTPSDNIPPVTLSYPMIMLIDQVTPNEKDPEAFDIKFAATIDKETLASIIYSSRAHGVLVEVKAMDPRANYTP